MSEHDGAHIGNLWTVMLCALTNGVFISTFVVRELHFVRHVNPARVSEHRHANI